MPNSTKLPAGVGGLSGPRTRRVYFAAPLPEFNTQRYARLYRVVCDHYTGCVVFEAKRLFESNTHWIGTWPTLLPTLHELVFIATADGWIGRGLAFEIDTAAGRGLPVLWLTDAGGFLEFARFQRSAPNPASWQHYQRVSVDSPPPPTTGRPHTRGKVV